MGIFSLALAYGIKQWRWKEAEVLMVQVIEGRESLFGPENATTLLAKANIAKIIVGQGRWAEAEQLLVKVTEAKKRVLGQGHLHTLSSMGWLGATYVMRGRIVKLLSRSLKLSSYFFSSPFWAGIMGSIDA